MLCCACSVALDSLWPPQTGCLVHGDSPGKNYWNGLPCPPPEYLPKTGIKPRCPTLQAGSWRSEPPGKPNYLSIFSLNCFLIQPHCFTSWFLRIKVPIFNINLFNWRLITLQYCIGFAKILKNPRHSLSSKFLYIFSLLPEILIQSVKQLAFALFRSHSINRPSQVTARDTLCKVILWCQSYFPYPISFHLLPPWNYIFFFVLPLKYELHSKEQLFGPHMCTVLRACNCFWQSR